MEDDIVMPVMGGKELSTRLAAEPPDLPLIWMSGNPSDDTLPAESAGAGRPFLTKPVSPGVLIDTVQDVLARASAHST